MPARDVILHEMQAGLQSLQDWPLVFSWATARKAFAGKDLPVFFQMARHLLVSKQYENSSSG